jgi:hypothetical protein
MTDVQIAQVLTYVRDSWGNNAPAVTDDVVKAERAILGTAQDNGPSAPSDGPDHRRRAAHRGPG